MLFIPYLNDSGLYQPVYGLGWSLNYEMFFYTILAVTLCLPLRLATLMICTVIGGLILAGLGLDAKLSAYPGWQLSWFYTRPVMAYFLAGVLARALPFHAMETRLAANRNALAVGASLLAAYCAYRTRDVEWQSALWIFVLIRAASSHVSYAGLWRQVRDGMGFVGDASYSLYLTHSFVLGAITICIGRVVHAPALAALASLVVGMACALALAALVYAQVEQPGVRRFKRWLLRWGARRCPCH